MDPRHFLSQLAHFPLLSSPHTVRSSLSPALHLPVPQQLQPSKLHTSTLTKHTTRKYLRTIASAAAIDNTMVTEKPVEKFRKDYRPTPYLIDTVHLDFKLNEESTLIHSRLAMVPNAASEAENGSRADLFLNGREDIKLVSVSVAGKELAPGADGYSLTPKSLTISGSALPAGNWELEIVTKVKPQENSLLEGLYKSGGNYCTQCEAEGFRGITFFLDRPDVMAKYTTRIEADKASYPVLLGNGNLVDSGDLDGGRHYAMWEDPFNKPCYLFALVAGNLAMQEGTFKTMSGRDVTLRIYVQEHNLNKVDFAMQSLIRSMKWDEDTFGLEYDLDIFNIVAVDDFNMGAMENKSLNIFNSRLVLATPDTATDGDFARIEGVVGHEYFHNWTGNRVTCRDWFQLTLKEGLTVYRDQEFSADMNSRPVKRIKDAVRLRSAQFAEDGGPMAHPVRPESYIKMDNFYTLTVYEKGAELVRMYEALLGKEGFRKGMDLYFKRHDGQAVTCDDFLSAMADANGEDFTDLAKWYGQAGTPLLTVIPIHDPATRTLTLKVQQSTPPSNGQAEKVPLLIPLRTALLSGQDGKPLPLHLRGVGDVGTEVVLRVTKAEEEFVFEGIEGEQRPIASLLRGFSAPVKMTVEGQTDEDLLFILAHDTDPFNRWEAGQVLAKKQMLKLYNGVYSKNGIAASSNGSLEDKLLTAGGLSAELADAFKSLLTDSAVDGTFKAFAISLPADTELIDVIPGADPTGLHKVREFLTKQLAVRLRPELEAAVTANDAPAGEPYVFNAAACAKRALKNKALGYLACLGDDEINGNLLTRFREATNMTDEISALAALDRAGGAPRDTALAEFYKKWEKEPLVILKWVALQAGSNAPDNVHAVKALVNHPAFNITNPNNCYSLFLAFARSPVNFHKEDGSGYEFMGDAVLTVDKINRQVAARMVGAFTNWRNFDEKRQGLMKAQLERIVKSEGLSENVYEIASKSCN